MGIRRIKRYYSHQPVDLNGLMAVREIFNRRFEATDSRKYRLLYGPDEYEIDAWDDVQTLLREKGQTTRFSVMFRSNAGRYASFDNTSSAHIIVEFRSTALKVEDEIARIETALSLTPLHGLIRTAFVAHGFDEIGTTYARQVGEFLQLLGIDVTTGEYFEPASVSQKVKRRIAECDIFVAIVTPQDDRTWIIQEITLADSLDKRPFVLIEASVEQKRGLRGDNEEVFFSADHVSDSFIKLLQGLRRLRGDNE